MQEFSELEIFREEMNILNSEKIGAARKDRPSP
jgi:hypothetical protein